MGGEDGENQGLEVDFQNRKKQDLVEVGWRGEGE